MSQITLFKSAEVQPQYLQMFCTFNMCHRNDQDIWCKPYVIENNFIKSHFDLGIK